MLISEKSQPSVALRQTAFFSLAFVLSVVASTSCWAMASVTLPKVASSPPVVKPIVTKDADNVSLQSILKPEQKKPEEAYAIGGIDAYTAETRPTTNTNGNLWQVVLALFGVSAGAWWVLNTAWFKALAQQKEAQLLQKNGAYSPSSPVLTAPISTTHPSRFKKTTDWVVSFLRPELAESSTAEPALANILQTLPLPSGQFLVMIQIGDTVHSLAVGGTHQPLLVGTWPASQLLGFHGSLAAAEAVHTEKWMAQTPPTPTTTVRKEDPLSLAEVLTDYEALNESEEALFGQLLKQETATL